MNSMRELLDIFEEELSEGEKCPQCGSTECTCPPGECDCDPVEEGLPMAVEPSQEQKETESVNYSKTKSKGSASVTVSARADSMEELHDVLKLAGITLPQSSGEPEAQPEPEEMPCEPPEEMDPDAHGAMPMSTDKSVITGVLRDRLRDYLRNSR